MNVPKLRFPGFEGEWEETTVSEITKSYIGLTYSPDSIVSEGGILVLRSSNIKNGIIDLTDRVYVSSPVPSNCVVRKDDILLCSRNGSKALIGKTALIKEENEGHAFGAFMMVIRSNQNRFLFQFFQTAVFFEQIEKNFGATINQITSANLKAIYLSLPSLAEQQKIASFLSSVDNVIQLLTKKKTLLENYKKGIMQKIFSQEIRFKDENGNDFPDWEEKKLGEVARLLYGKDQKSIVSENGKNPILGTGGIIGSTNDFLYDQPSVLIGRKGTIDKPFYLDKPFWTVDTLFYTEVFKNTIPRWLFYKFQTINWYLYNEASGVPSLSASTISKIEIPLPSLPEQQKIADFLSGIDRTIDIVNSQMEKAKEYKKGLLQKMFV